MTILPLPPSLAARYPLETIPLRIGARTWQISCVTDQDALLDGVNDAEQMPYGFLLWESAVMLAEWLVNNPTLVKNRSILELGAGVGLAGLVARSLRGNVWLTDHRADLLELAAHNARQNYLAPPQQFVADWQAWDHETRYDLILGADILYERAMHRHLLPIFRQNLAPGGRLVLTDPSRPQALELIAALEDDGWQITIEMQTLTLPLLKRVTKAVEVALLVCTTG